MRLLIILLVLLAAPHLVFCQEFKVHRLDYVLIKKDIEDSTSAFFYPRLLKRLDQYDSTLTTEDFRHLYFGYTFQPQYQPDWRSPDEEKLLKYYRSKELSAAEYDDVTHLASHSITEFPFDLRQLNYLAYTYHLKGDNSSARKLQLRLLGIIGAILSTGDGKTCETSWHVITVSHEYVILNIYRLPFESQTLTTDQCDYLKLKANEKNVSGLYFDVKRLFEKRLENHAVDKPVIITASGGQKKFDEAIAPYVAQARQTLPDAKKKFLQGLRPGESFSLVIRLYDEDGKFEQVFVRVEEWGKKKITGSIANNLDIVKGYKKGQQVKFSEKDILDWVISKSDGSEEGNFVGKFLDSQH